MFHFRNCNEYHVTSKGKEININYVEERKHFISSSANIFAYIKIFNCGKNT